jgi:hypothetical protein
VKQIHIITVIASRTGLKHIAETFPTNVCVYAAVVDDELTKDGIVLPGLGDAGDRQFGTHVVSNSSNSGNTSLYFNADDSDIIMRNGSASIAVEDDSLVHPSKRKRSNTINSRSTTPLPSPQVP